MEPAASILAAFGGAPKVAAIVGVHRTRVWNWTQPRSKGGTDGFIPPRHAAKLLAHALEHGVPGITAASFTLPAGAAA